MKLNDMLHLIAGTLIFISVLLGFYVSAYFYLFTAFIGLNLIQSAFSKWCPMITILRRLGFE